MFCRRRFPAYRKHLLTSVNHGTSFTESPERRSILTEPSENGFRGATLRYVSDNEKEKSRGISAHAAAKHVILHLVVVAVVLTRPERKLRRSLLGVHFSKHRFREAVTSDRSGSPRTHKVHKQQDVEGRKDDRLGVLFYCPSFEDRRPWARQSTAGRADFRRPLFFALKNKATASAFGSRSLFRSC